MTPKGSSPARFSRILGTALNGPYLDRMVCLSAPGDELRVVTDALPYGAYEYVTPSGSRHYYGVRNNRLYSLRDVREAVGVAKGGALYNAKLIGALDSSDEREIL